MAFVAEKTTAFQRVNIGKSATMGTLATMGTKLASISVKASPKVMTNPFTPQGSLYPTLMPVGKDYVEWKMEGSPVYEELDWVLGSVLCTAAAGVYNPSAVSANTPDFYSFQFGESGSCYSVPDAVLASLDMKYSRDKIDMSGSGIGGKMISGTWNASATQAATLTPMLPADTTITLAGVTLTRAFQCDLSITNRWKDVWTVNKAATSYANVVETIPTASIKLTMEVDAAFGTILTDMRSANASKEFIITTANASQSLAWSANVMVQDITEFKDQDGVYAVDITFGVVNNGTYAIKATLDSTPA